MLFVVTLLALVSTALSTGYGQEGLSFQGTFTGQCGNDGFYYMDSDTYVMCSNGNAYRQRCAPGSKNSPPGSYRIGQVAAATTFCDVNLVDFGYTLQFANSGKGGYGSGRAGAGFGAGHGSFNQIGAGRFGGFAGGKGAGFRSGFGGFGGFGAGNKAGLSKFIGAGYGNLGMFGGFGGSQGGYGAGHRGVTFAQLGQPASKFGIGAGTGTAGAASFGLLGGQIKGVTGFSGRQKGNTFGMGAHYTH